MKPIKAWTESWLLGLAMQRTLGNLTRGLQCSRRGQCLKDLAQVSMGCGGGQYKHICKEVKGSREMGQ